MKYIHQLFDAKFSPLPIVFFGFLYGLLFVFLLPPWQHHDEPGHFEYAWMIANLDKIPQVGAYDNTARQMILDSMKRHQFFGGEDLEALGEASASMDPVWIGVTQVGDPPLYYWLAAQVIRLMDGRSVETQLYAARIISLFFWVAVLVVAWVFAREVTPPNHPLQWIMPLSMALIPAFVEHSTAMNNDVAATLVYSLILLFGIRLLHHGWRPLNIAALLILMGLSYFTKASIWLAFLVVPLAFFFTLLRRFNAGWALASLGGLALIGVFFLFDYQDAALWLRQTPQSEPTRVNTSYGWAYQLVDDRADTQAALWQIIPDQPDLHGSKVTLGAWMWGKAGQQAYPPALRVLHKNYQVTVLRSDPITLQETPTFYSASFELPEKYRRLYFQLDPLPEVSETGVVYARQPVMVTGVYLANQPLSLAEDGKRGTWRGEPFTNLVRNSTLNQAWPVFKPEIIQLFGQIDPRISEAANWVIYALDTEATGWYTYQSALNLFQSFWAKFGWGHITLGSLRAYLLPFLFSVVGLTCGLIVYWRHYPYMRVQVFTWMGIAMLCVLFYAWFTGVSTGAFTLKAYLPDSRYIFPIAMPLMMLMASGWYGLICKLPINGQKAGLGLYFLFFFYVNVLSIFTIARFYYSD